MSENRFGTLQCSVCQNVFNSLQDLGAHFRIHEPCIAYVCGQGECKQSFRSKASMIRHISTAVKHRDIFNENAQNQVEVPDPPAAPGEAHINLPDADAPQGEAELNNEDENSVVPDPLSIEDELKKLAVDTLLELRSTSSLTGKAVERFEKGCFNMLKQFSQKVHENISNLLSARGMPLEEISVVLKDLELEKDPFDDLRTIDEQLKYFHEKFGLVIPQSKFLGTRIDQRLDTRTNSFTAAVVNETFQYVSVIENLKLILSNKSIRNKIFKDKVSKDGVLRSYVDGYHYKDHPFLKREEVVIHILLFFDELEITNSLGSKTIIHKLATFFYQILNLPPEVSSRLSSIYLLVLAHADDLKKEGVMEKILGLLEREMKILSSEEGVDFEIDGENFKIRAVLVALTADNAAAHDVLGFIQTSARHFCRWCMVSRAQMRADANVVAIPRDIETHKIHVAAVTANPRLRILYGVKKSCPLDKIPHFNCIDNNVFDIFHDILEGVGELDVKCVLHHYATLKPIPKFTHKEFNSKVASFSYGIPDSKNKPSPNFSHDMLTGSANLNQSGSQMWCLIRSLPFLLADLVTERDEYLELIFLLQDAIQIIFAFEVRPEDLDRLGTLIYKHNELFMKLFINKPQLLPENQEQEQEEDIDNDLDGIGEEEEIPVQPAPVQPVPNEQNKKEKKKKKAWRVYVTNKVHQMTHLPEMMRKFGPAVRMWCAKFEGRMKIFRQHASICCNFQNPPKTMAAMFQLSTLKPIITEEEEFSVDFQTQGPKMMVRDSIHCASLIRCGLGEDEQITYTNSATLNGEEYRPGLFVCLPDSVLTRPKFAIISDVVVTTKALYLVTKQWTNLGLSERYNAYECVPPIITEYKVFDVLSLTQFRCIAPWSVGLTDVYIMMKTI